MANMKDILKEGMVFRSKDKEGDLVDEIMFVGKPPVMSKGPYSVGKVRKSLHIYVIFSDGGSDWYSLRELNIDRKSVKKYDPDCQIDFYGAHG